MQLIWKKKKKSGTNYSLKKNETLISKETQNTRPYPGLNNKIPVELQKIEKRSKDIESSKTSSPS